MMRFILKDVQNVKRINPAFFNIQSQITHYISGSDLGWQLNDETCTSIPSWPLVGEP